MGPGPARSRGLAPTARAPPPGRWLPSRRRRRGASMQRPVKFGVTLPQIKRTWAEAKAAAQEFEALGYDSLWVCDHLYGVPAPDIPILEAWSELAAVAAITERVQL